MAWLPWLAAGLFAPSARAWDRHDLLTRLAIADVKWLASAAPIRVTTRTARLPRIRQDYAFPYHGEKTGERMRPADILVRYAAEPDWGPDQELDVSWQQRFMGGYTGMSSRGYFHMFYPAWTAHLPFPFAEMGAAPERAELYTGASTAAFKRGDPYWGVRYLACALHYVEDVGQPYHATQTSIRFLVPARLIQGTTKVTSNYHLLYEAWVGKRLEKGELDFGKSLGGTAATRYPTPADTVRAVAAGSHAEAERLFAACVEFFGDRFHQPVDVKAQPADLARMAPEGPRDRIALATRSALSLTARAVRGFLERARPFLVAGTP